MKPLNQAAKRKAINKFIGIYVLSLLLVLLSSFFLFRTPVKIQMDEIRSYQDFKSSNSLLTSNTSKITAQISELIEVEKVIYDDSSSGLESMITEYRQRINKVLESLKEDSANNAFPLLEKNLNNYLVAYNAVLFYCQNNFNLRKILYTQKGNSPVNTGTGQILQLQREREQLQNENTVLKNNLAIAKTKTEQPPKVAPDLSANDQVNKLTSQLEGMQNKLTLTERDRDNYKNQLAQKTDELKKKETDVKPIPKTETSICSEEERAILLYQNADQLIKSGQSESRNIKKGVYIAAQFILKKIQNTHPDKALITAKLREVKTVIDQKVGDF